MCKMKKNTNAPQQNGATHQLFAFTLAAKGQFKHMPRNRR